MNSTEGESVGEEINLKDDNQEESSSREERDVELEGLLQTSVQSQTDTELSIGCSCVKISKKLDTFLTKCQEIIGGTESFKIIHTRAQNASDYLETPEFLEKFDQISNVDDSPANLTKAIVALNYLLICNRNVHTDINNKILEKLYDKLRRTHNVLETLSEKDDFDVESKYANYAAYIEKAVLIVNRIRKLEEKPMPNHLSCCEPLKFNQSSYQEFNAALTKKFSSFKKCSFPSFYRVNKYLRHCANSKGVLISEEDLCDEIRRCYVALTTMMKERRQRDFIFLYPNCAKKFKQLHSK